MNERKQFAEEIHRRVVRKFQRRKVIVHRMDEIWGIDLASMETSAFDGYKFILCIIDVFSKYVWCVPLKNKMATTVLNAVKDVVKQSDRIPEKIWVDQGSEFYNKEFKAWITSQDIIMYSTFGDSKSAVVERFIRTLRELLAKNLATKNTKDWVKLLPKIVHFYNNKFHKTIEMTPTEASNPKNHLKVFLLLNSDQSEKKTKKPTLRVGDHVRISRIKGTFEKGSAPNFSHEIFKVSEVLNTKPVTYKLVDYHEEPITGSFYEQELLKSKVPRLELKKKSL